MAFPRATTMAHQLVGERLLPGDFTIDATAGNGHDTLFLAKAVGPTGHVLAIDIQESAIEAARLRCAEYKDIIDFKVADHSNLRRWINRETGAVMFNLGYLPSSDKTIITQPESTLKAVVNALESLRNGGILTIAVYYGHPGGDVEAEAVSLFTQSLDQTRFTAIRYEFLNQKNNPPFLIAIERRDI